MSFERNTAIKCTILDIAKGIFIKKEGFESSYVITDYGNISRANILGVVVSIESNTLIIDDGTGKIPVKSFESLKKIPGLGDVVLIIGKLRMYNKEKYIVPEIIKKIENNKWIDYRKKELDTRTKIKQDFDDDEAPQEKNQKTDDEIRREFSIANDQTAESPQLNQESEKKMLFTESNAEKIMKFIKQNDEGRGVSISEIAALNIENQEKIIQTLLAQGEIFEIRAGFVKVME